MNHVWIVTESERHVECVFVLGVFSTPEAATEAATAFAAKTFGEYEEMPVPEGNPEGTLEWVDMSGIDWVRATPHELQ